MRCMAPSALLRPGHIIRARGDAWVIHRHIPGPDGSILEVRGRGIENRGTRTSFLLPYEPIECLPASTAPHRLRGQAWRRLARSVLTTGTPSYDALRSPSRATLTVLPFQLEPVLALVRGIAARVLIADEVGLGKTIQAGLIISELLERRPDARALVITPAGLRDQWQTELRERFAHEPTLLDSASITRHATQWSGNPWSIPGIVLTSLDYVKRPEVVRALEALVWDVLVFDEAHSLAGRSDRATVAGLLARRARTLVLLSATPHSGDDQAFARLTSLGDFEQRFPLLVFRRTRGDVGLISSRRTVSLRVRPTTHESAMHHALMDYARRVWRQTGAYAASARLAMTVLTRRACSSAWSLARSIETRLRLLDSFDSPDLPQLLLPFGESAADDDAPGVELRAPGLSDRDDERRQLTHLLGLAHAAAARSSKFRALRRLLRRSREPAIVFTEYRDTIHQLADELRELEPVQLHGGMTSSERRQALDRFVRGEARLLLATDAASEGLNLHRHCRLVINLELPWTPVRLEQRIGRVERIGQTRRVHAVHLLGAGTCEEESVAVLLTRMRRVASVLGGLRAGSVEYRIAEAAIGGGDPSLDQNAELIPKGLLSADLRAAAVDEAARLTTVRALFGGNHTEPFWGRPSIGVLRRVEAQPVNDWIYRLVFEDVDLQPLWTTVVGIRDRTAIRPFSMQAIRSRLESRNTEVALYRTERRLREALQVALELPRSLAMSREQAIADGLQQQRARLAASLLQPGLFDHRAERVAAAQNATLDQALVRCARRLAELSHADATSVDRRFVLGLVGR